MWAITEGESRTVATAAINLQKQFPPLEVDPRVVAAVGFVIAVGTVYGPRVTAQIAINKMTAPARTVRTAPSAPQAPTAEMKVGASGGRAGAVETGDIDPFKYQ